MILLFAVQCRIFSLIGRLARDYPDCIENEARDGPKIRDMYFKALEDAVVSQHDVSNSHSFDNFTTELI